MARWAIVVACGGATALGACSLLTPLDGYTQDAPESASELDGGSAPDERTDADVRSRDGASPEGAPDVDASLSYPNAVFLDGPVAYYRLGDSSGVAKDEIGQRHGTYQQDVSHAPGAIVGDDDTAAVFEGNGFVDLGENFAFLGRVPYSIELWISVGTVGGTWCAFAKNSASVPADGPNAGYAMYFLDSRRARFVRYGDLAEDGAHSAALAENTFTHVVGTYDGENLSVYVDGELDASSRSERPVAPALNGFTIGASRGGTTCRFRGTIDEVAIYDKALPAERIRAHYRIGRGLD